MPRYKLGARVTGPYYCEARKKWRIFVYDGPKTTVRSFDTEKAARKGLSQATKELRNSASRILSDVMAEYFAEKEQREVAKSRTCKNQESALRRMLTSYLNDDISRMTPNRASDLYARTTETPTRKTGKPPSAASHRFYLVLAQGFYGWALGKGYIRQNPFKEVRPIGRASTGKTQLRLDEAKRYREAALRLFDEQNDRLALAAVLPLYLGLRADEVMGRRVRDIDAGGSIIWIDRGKSKNARRHLSVKARPIQQRLARLVSGRAPEEALFSVGNPLKLPVRQMINIATKRVCKAAGVPVICPHSLRGLWATLSVESGAAESAVATALGHGSFEMTAKHYAQPEALTGAKSARVHDLLEDVAPAPGVTQLSAEQIVSSLPPETLAKLLALLTASTSVENPEHTVGL